MPIQNYSFGALLLRPSLLGLELKDFSNARFIVADVDISHPLARVLRISVQVSNDDTWETVLVQPIHVNALVRVIINTVKDITPKILGLPRDVIVYDGLENVEAVLETIGALAHLQEDDVDNEEGSEDDTEPKEPAVKSRKRKPVSKSKSNT